MEAPVKLPKWIPQVSEPWNDAYKATWNCMTPDERRWSFLIDVAMLATFGALLLLLWVWLT
jgi:hypothetical protein